MNPVEISRQNLFRIFFFGAFLFLIYQLIRILTPFVGPLLSAITLVLIFYPVHGWLRRRMGERKNAAAALSTGLILLLVIVPTLFFLWLVAKQATAAYPTAREWVLSIKDGAPADTLDLNSPAPPSSPLHSAVFKFRSTAKTFMSSWQIDSQDLLLKTVDHISNGISSFGRRLVKNAVFLVFNIFVMGFTLFFLFRDGQEIARRVMALVPMESSQKEHILKRLDQTLSAVVRGSFITASVQGFLAGIGFTVVGIPFSVLLGFTTAFFALIPFVGAAVIWLPVGLYFFAAGATWKGVFLLVWGAGVVSLVDNFLKPILIGEKANLPIFLLFFGILGGLQVYGVVGGLIGPLVITSVLAFAKIYREEIHSASPGEPAQKQP